MYWDIVYFTQDYAEMIYDSCLTFSIKIMMVTVPLCLKLLLKQSPAYAVCVPSLPHEKLASDELALADTSVHMWQYHSVQKDGSLYSPTFEMVYHLTWGFPAEQTISCNMWHIMIISVSYPYKWAPTHKNTIKHAGCYTSDFLCWAFYRKLLKSLVQKSI